MKIIIDGQQYQNFESYSLKLQYNSLADSFSFAGLRNFLPEPLSYPRVEVYKNNELLITGTIVNQKREIKAAPTLVSVSGYSLPGVLQDVNVPVELYPLQSDNLSLQDIADKILPYFGVDYVKQGTKIEQAINKKFTKTVAGGQQSVKQYLNKLASQRGIIVTHDNQGRIVFQKGIALNPPVRLQNIESISIDYPGQRLHSDITVIRQSSRDNPDAGQATVSNPLVGAARPKTKILNDGDIFDVDAAADNELRAELANVSLQLKTREFVLPGTIIDFENVPGAWFVETTEVKGNAQSENYSYSCVPREVYE